MAFKMKRSSLCHSLSRAHPSGPRFSHLSREHNTTVCLLGPLSLQEGLRVASGMRSAFSTCELLPLSPSLQLRKRSQMPSTWICSNLNQDVLWQVPCWTCTSLSHLTNLHGTSRWLTHHSGSREPQGGDGKTRIRCHVGIFQLCGLVHVSLGHHFLILGMLILLLVQ